MYWLNMSWITENWVPLLVALVLGYLIGWLLTGMSPARRVRELDARARDLEAKQRKTDRELADARSDNTKAKASLTTALADLENARTRTRTLEEKVATLEEAAEESAASDAAVADLHRAVGAAAEEDADETAEMEVLVAAMRAAMDAPVDEGASEDFAGADEDAYARDNELAVRTAAPVALAPDQIAESFAAVARTPEAIEADNARQIALTEAYNRAAQLQAELQERDKVLGARQAELESVKAELLTANAARHELDNRLVRAREDVASELAVLASTMIKMKDDALARAEARMSALNNELNGLRAELETLAARGSQAAVEPAVIEAPIADVAAGEVTDEPSDAA